jgi:hypothetical protein
MTAEFRTDICGNVDNRRTETEIAPEHPGPRRGSRRDPKGSLSLRQSAGRQRTHGAYPLRPVALAHGKGR